MAIVSSGSFTAISSKIAGTTLAFTASQNILSGDLATLFVAMDNPTTGTNTNFVTSVTDNSINYNFAQGTGFNATVRTITSQSDGKILVGGDFTTYNGQTVNQIVRLNTDGTLDTTFSASLTGGNVFKIATFSDNGFATVGGVWTNIPAAFLNIVRGCIVGIGTQNEALTAGGNAASNFQCTEEYNGSTWANSNALITGRFSAMGAGTQNAGLIAGGLSGSALSNTEEYDGTVWTAGGSLITARGYLAGAGIQNEALAFGGLAGPSFLSCTEEYNGTSWSVGGTLITTRRSLGGAGTQNAGLAFGGITPSIVSCTEEYDGSSWASGGSLIVARWNLAGTGNNQETALAVGGIASGRPNGTDFTEEYNGTVWSAGGPLTSPRFLLGAAGNSSAGVAFGGGDPFTTGLTEEYNPGLVSFCTMEKIAAVGSFNNRTAILQLDGNIDTFFNVSSSFNNTVCTVIVQPSLSYSSSIGAWSTVSGLITCNQQLAGAGTQNAGLVFGGANFNSTFSCTEEYNGSTWTIGGAMNAARWGLAGVGTQNEALAFGGYSGSIPLSCTEEYNGSIWTVGNALVTDNRYNLAGAGTQNSGLAFGGFSGSVSFCTEEYDGSTWTSGGALITARYTLAGSGTQNEALAIGGSNLSITLACTEEYNGTSWSTGGILIVSRSQLTGAGTQNASLAFGGSTPSPGALSCTETYNGTSWSINSSLNTPRRNLAGLGIQNEALAAGGEASYFNFLPVYATEEFNTGPALTNKLIFGGIFTSYQGTTYSGSVRTNGDGTIDTSFNIGAGFSPVDVRCYQFYNGINLWSVGGALINARGSFAGAGTQNEGLAFGGGSPIAGCTEEYDGSVWTAGGNLIVGRSSLAGAGTQNAGLAFGGANALGCTEEYNGTSWAVGNPLIVSRDRLGGAGTQNAGLAFAGSNPITVTCTEEYDGTSWTTGNTMLTGRYNLAGAGTQNAGLAFGGANVSICSDTEEYNGTSWASGGALITALWTLAGAGTQNAGLSFGGRDSGGTIIACTEKYNGTSWTTGGALINARSQLGGAGTQNEGLAFGGFTSPASPSVACTEEYSILSGLLSAGNFTSVSGSGRARIALLNADTGDLIPTSSFNMGSAGFGANVNSLAVQSDNTIIAVGNFTAYSGSNINRIAKLNTDGTLDTAFSASIGAGLNAEAAVVTNSLTSSIGIWSVGGAMITARYGSAGAGNNTLGLAAGGFTTTAVTTTEEYNGTSWAAGGALITARYYTAGAGTQNLGLAFGGANVAECANTEEYNGTSWAAGGALITARFDLAGAGTQNAGLAIAGGLFGGVCVACTEEYNGTSWTAGNILITARRSLGGAGTQNLGLAIGGSAPTLTTCTEEYDGTTWTAGGALINARNGTGTGTQNEALAFGGGSPVNTEITEEYNGTSWSLGGNLITPRSSLAGAGLQSAALAFGGTTTGNVTCTEEYATATNRLLLGGAFTSFAGNARNGAIRIFDTGRIDGSFNIGSGFGTVVDVEDFLIETDVNNGIIAVGNFTTYSGSFSPSPTRIVKLTSNGSIDAAQIGNTWSKVREFSSNDAAGAGSTLALFYLTASYDLYAGLSLTASLSASVTSKAATGWRFVTDRAAIAYTGSVTASAAGGTSQPLRIGLSNLTSGSGEYLFIRGVAFEADTTTTFTPTANYTTMSAAGTTGGANITNQSVRGEFRILTTSSYFSNPTLGAASSQASIFWTFYESPAAARGRTYFILLD